MKTKPSLTPTEGQCTEFSLCPPTKRQLQKFHNAFLDKIYSSLGDALIFTQKNPNKYCGAY